MENFPSALSNIHKLSQFLILKGSFKWGFISSHQQSGSYFWRDPSTFALILSCGILFKERIRISEMCFSKDEYWIQLKKPKSQEL